MIKRILCLANSRKLHGTCVAGREIIDGRPGAWVRPVSDREHQEVSFRERRLQNGSEPRLLDVIDVPVLRRQPEGHQQENWLLDPSRRWSWAGTLMWDALALYADPVDRLWVDGHSTSQGSHDRVPLSMAQQLRSSLALVAVESVELAVSAPGQAFGNPTRRIQARFTLSGKPYRLRVTDPVQERRYLARPDGTHQLGRCYLTISLSEPFQGHCYKLVAGIMEAPTAGQGGLR